MCWNADISLNTFVFACLALVFIYVANTYTKYSASLFDNKFMYVFMLDVAAIQLVEFFLWKNLKNASRNELLSKLLAFLVVVQPFILTIMIPNATLRKGMLAFDAVCILCFVYFVRRFHTSVASNGHLSWDWTLTNGKSLNNGYLVTLCGLIYLTLYGVPILAINNFKFSLFILVILGVSLFNYFKYNSYQTFGSMWCWTGNLFLLYMIVDLLLVQPFHEYNGLC